MCGSHIRFNLRTFYSQRQYKMKCLRYSDGTREGYFRLNALPFLELKIPGSEAVWYKKMKRVYLYIAGDVLTVFQLIAEALLLTY